VTFALGDQVPDLNYFTGALIYICSLFLRTELMVTCLCVSEPLVKQCILVVGVLGKDCSPHGGQEVASDKGTVY
jgi:hypothetical protein